MVDSPWKSRSITWMSVSIASPSSIAMGSIRSRRSHSRAPWEWWMMTSCIGCVPPSATHSAAEPDPDTRRSSCSPMSRPSRARRPTPRHVRRAPAASFGRRSPRGVTVLTGRRCPDRSAGWFVRWGGHEMEADRCIDASGATSMSRTMGELRTPHRRFTGRTAGAPRSTRATTKNKTPGRGECRRHADRAPDTRDPSPHRRPQVNERE